MSFLNKIKNNNKTNKYKKQEKLISKIIEEKNKKNNNLKLELFLDYEPLIISISNSILQKYKYTPLEFDDYKQYCTHKFFERTKKYDLNSQKKFANYIKDFLILDLDNFARKFANNKHRALNYYVSINEEDVHQNNKNEEISNSINFSILKKEQIKLINSLIKNEGNIKKVSNDLKIPIKTIYRHKNIIIQKLHQYNNIET